MNQNFLTTINKYGLQVVLIFFMLIFTDKAEAETGIKASSGNELYIRELIKKAYELKLYDDIYWHTLLHYKKNFYGGYTSRIDDPSFFFAADGKNNPSGEMDATIKSFFRLPEKK